VPIKTLLNLFVFLSLYLSTNICRTITHDLLPIMFCVLVLVNITIFLYTLSHPRTLEEMI